MNGLEITNWVLLTYLCRGGMKLKFLPHVAISYPSFIRSNLTTHLLMLLKIIVVISSCLDFRDIPCLTAVTQPTNNGTCTKPQKS